MPQATFYTHVADTASFIRRLSTRAVEAGARVLVWVQSDGEIGRISLDLWSNPPESFRAHEIWQNGTAYPDGVSLVLAAGTEPPEIPAGIVVLNLSEDFWCDAPVVPARVLEIVGTDLDELAAARERFRAYKQKGFQIEHHDMKGKA